MARFTRFTLSPPRSLGRRLRGAAVAALVVGAVGVFIPGGGRVAHAATMACTPPAPINSTISASASLGAIGPVPIPVAAFDSGALTVKVDGSSVTFYGTGNGANSNLGLGGGVNGTPVFNALPGCTVPGLVGGPIGPGNVSGSFTITLPGALGLPVGSTATCDVNTVTSVTLTQQLSDGSDSIAVTCKIAQGGSLVLNLNLGAVGVPVVGGGTATPELSSGELLATGLLPVVGLFLYRRRRQRRAAK